MPKIRLTRTTVVEYEPDPEYYPDGATLEQMAQIDANTDDRELLFECTISDDVRWEIIDGDET